MAIRGLLLWWPMTFLSRQVNWAYIRFTKPGSVAGRKSISDEYEYRSITGADYAGFISPQPCCPSNRLTVRWRQSSKRHIIHISVGLLPYTRRVRDITCLSVCLSCRLSPNISAVVSPAGSGRHGSDDGSSQFDPLSVLKSAAHE